MPPAAVPVTLTASERKILKKRVRGAKTPYRDRVRAQVVLAAARGRDNTRIAADLGISVNAARKWRGRFADRGLAGLKDLPRSGRPREISEADRGRSASPPSPCSANRPRHLRTIFTLAPRSAAIRALPRPREAASTICARARSRYGVFAPRTLIFSVLRSDAVSVTGTAAGGIAAPGGKLQQCN